MRYTKLWKAKKKQNIAQWTDNIFSTPTTSIIIFYGTYSALLALLQ